MSGFVRSPATNNTDGWEFGDMLKKLKTIKSKPGHDMEEMLAKLGIMWADSIHVVSAIEPHEALQKFTGYQ